MQKILLAGAFASILLAGPAFGQNAVVQYKATATTPGSIPVTPGTPLPVTGTFSASLGGFVPSLGYATLTATAASSASTALPTNTGTVAFQNNTANTVSCTLASGSAAALVNEILVPAGSTVFVGTTGFDHAACINQTGSASNVIVLAGGSGLGTGFGGGSAGGGSSGAVFGPTAVGSAAGNPPVLTGGTVDGTATGNVGVWKIVSGIGYLNMAQMASVAITCVPTAYGTAPTGNCIGVNAFVTNTNPNGSTNADGVAAAASNVSPVQSYGLLFNGTTFDRQRSGTQTGSALTNGATNQTPTNCSGTIATGGTAQNAFTAQTTLHGFTIANIDSGHNNEVMWISFTTTAAASTAASYPLPAPTATSFAGFGSFTTPAGFGTNVAVSVIAATSGHIFSCTWW